LSATAAYGRWQDEYENSKTTALSYTPHCGNDPAHVLCVIN